MTKKQRRKEDMKALARECWGCIEDMLPHNPEKPITGDVQMDAEDRIFRAMETAFELGRGAGIDLLSS